MKQWQVEYYEGPMTIQSNQATDRPARQRVSQPTSVSSWCFQSSQPQRITSNWKQTSIFHLLLIPHKSYEPQYFLKSAKLVSTQI